MSKRWARLRARSSSFVAGDGAGSAGAGAGASTRLWRSSSAKRGGTGCVPGIGALSAGVGDASGAIAETSIDFVPLLPRAAAIVVAMLMAAPVPAP